MPAGRPGGGVSRSATTSARACVTVCACARGCVLVVLCLPVSVCTCESTHVRANTSQAFVGEARPSGLAKGSEVASAPPAPRIQMPTPVYTRTSALSWAGYKQELSQSRRAAAAYRDRRWHQRGNVPKTSPTMQQQQLRCLCASGGLGNHLMCVCMRKHPCMYMQISCSVISLFYKV